MISWYPHSHIEVVCLSLLEAVSAIFQLHLLGLAQFALHGQVHTRICASVGHVACQHLHLIIDEVAQVLCQGRTYL